MRVITGDGSLDLLILESDLPELMLISKIISFWLLIILPVIIFLPLGGIMLNMQPNDFNKNNFFNYRQ